MTEKQLINGLKKEEAKYKVKFKKATKDLALYFNKILGLIYFKPNYDVFIFEEKNKSNDNHICFRFKIPSDIEIFINDEQTEIYIKRKNANPMIMRCAHSQFKTYLNSLFFDGFKNSKGEFVPHPYLRYKFLATLFNRITRPGNLGLKDNK